MTTKQKKIHVYSDVMLTNKAFLKCSEVTYIPVNRDRTFIVQPMKELRDLKNGSLLLFGPEVLQCSPVDYDIHPMTSPTSPAYIPTTTASPQVSL